MTMQHNVPVEQRLQAAYAARLAGIDETALRPIPDLDASRRTTGTGLAGGDRRPRGQWFLIAAAACFVVIASVAIALATAGGGHHAPARPAHPSLTPIPPTSTSAAPSASRTRSETSSSRPTASSSTTASSRPPVTGASRWSGAVLVITGHSLGGVRIGMTSSQAARAAGVPAFVPVGDGVLQPSNAGPASALHLYLGNFAGRPASSVGGDFSCVGAGLFSATPRQVVTTEQGLRLGDPASRVRDIYGNRAKFVPAPASGMDPRPGYVVHQGRYDLIVKLDSHKSRVIAIAGGLAPLTPSMCVG